jgi:hypothetical protein
MASEAVQSTPAPAAVTPAAVPPQVPAPAGPPRPQPRRPSWALKPIRFLASLRLTVVLLTMSLFLVFLGTLAQIDGGIWTIVSKYFRTFWVWVPFQLFVQFGQRFFGFPATLRVGGSFPYPGGYVIGTLLVVNLLAAHIVRFKVSWKRSGILLIHAGLILMLVGELVTAVAAVESQMLIKEGESSSVAIDSRHSELAVIDPSAADEDDIVTVPGKMLRKAGAVVSHPDLPFDVEVVRWMVNSGVRRRAGSEDTGPATAGAGLAFVAEEKPEVSGTSAGQNIDYPSAYLTFKDKATGRPLGTYLASTHPDFGEKRQWVKAGGKRYRVDLRFKRTYRPYSLHLIKFRFDRYMGTQTPRNYSSEVRLVDAERGEDRVVTIRMNEPLRYRGETFYQQSFLPSENGTILQVVRNPGWLMPYASCVMVSLGMLIHFGISLSGFLGRRARP